MGGLPKKLKCEQKRNKREFLIAGKYFCDSERAKQCLHKGTNGPTRTKALACVGAKNGNLPLEQRGQN